MNKTSAPKTHFMNFTVNIVLLTLLLLCFEAKSQIVADAGGPYSVLSGESVVLNGTALIPGDNLRQIALGLLNHHDAYKEFPPAIVTDNVGNPLYSWRVAILPFIGEMVLYNQFDLSKAWDDPVNLPLLDQMPDVYRRLGANEEDNYTDFAVPIGPNAAFTGTDGIKIAQITDGTSNTMFVAEAAQADIPWSAPIDVNLDSYPGIDDPDGFSSDLEDVIMVSFADGSVKFLEKDAPQTLIDALFTRNGSELIDFSGIVVDPGTIDTYEWDLDDDGVFETTGANPDFDATGLLPGNYPVQMRVTTTTGINAIVSSIIYVTCSADNIIPCGNNKVIVCHVPPGNPANAHEICVSEQSANNHMSNHDLDYLGYCDCSTSSESAQTGDVLTLLDNQNHVEIYPNPIIDELHVKLWSEGKESIRLLMIDITGKLLSSNDQQAIKGENLFFLDVSNLKDGLYLLRVQSETRDEVFRVVKARYPFRE